MIFQCMFFLVLDNKIHQNNEEISIDDLMKATAIYAKAIYDLIKEQSEFSIPYCIEI